MSTLMEAVVIGKIMEQKYIQLKSMSNFCQRKLNLIALPI